MISETNMWKKFYPKLLTFSFVFRYILLTLYGISNRANLLYFKELKV